MAVTIGYGTRQEYPQIVGNSFTHQNQVLPDVLGLPTGGYVIAYNTNNTSISGVIVLDFFDANFSRIASLKTPYTAPTLAAGQPSLTLLLGGNVLVVWDDNEAGTPALYGRIYSATGNELTPELKLSPTATEIEDPQTAALAGGGFVISYTDTSSLGNTNVFVTRFDPLGNSLGGSLVSSNNSAGVQNDSAVAGLTDGGYVVTYTDLSPPVPGTWIRAAIYNADGTVRTSDYNVAVGSPSETKTSSKVVALHNGKWAVVYLDKAWPDESGSTGVSLQIYDRIGNNITPGQRIHVNIVGTPAEEADPDISLVGDLIVVTWISRTSPTAYEGKFRYFRQDGSAAGPQMNFDFNFPESPGTPKNAALSVIDPALFVTAWEETTGTPDGSGSAIITQVQTAVRGYISDDADDAIVGTILFEDVTGNGGKDTFIYQPGGGRDVFYDFESGPGVLDQIDLRAFTNVNSLQDVFSNASTIGVSADLYPSGAIAGRDRLTLQQFGGSSPLDLVRDDFILGRPDNDFNGDLGGDILWRHDDGTLVMWLLNSSGAIMSSKLFGSPGAVWQVAETGDFNRDGRTDILWRHFDGTVVTWLFDGSANVAWTQTLGNPGNSWRLAESADINRDGRADLLWRHTDGTVVAWLMNEISGMATQTLGNPGIGWRIHGSGDFNGDDRDDILWRHEDGRVVAWLLNEVGGMSTRLIGAPDGSWTVEAAGDINRDGVDDILWRHNDGTVVAWIVNAMGGFSSQMLARPGDSWKLEDAGDLNGDGRDDVLWRNSDGTVSAWLMDVNGSFTSSVLAGPEVTWHVQNDPTGIV